MKIAILRLDNYEMLIPASIEATSEIKNHLRWKGGFGFCHPILTL